MQNSLKSNSSDSQASQASQPSHLSTEYLKNIAWYFRQALHLNNQETIENLLNSVTLPLSKKNLLSAMLLTWKADKKAKPLLHNLITSADLIDRSWAFFSLSELYLTQGNVKDSVYFSDFVVKQVINKEPLLPSYLCSLLITWNINLKLTLDKMDSFNFDFFTSQLKKIISSSDTRLIKGYCYLTLARLEKLNPTNTFSSNSNSIDYLRQAISQLENIDYYYSSLAQIEMATSAKLEPSERQKLILSAQSNFKQLNKDAELNKATFLLSELTFQPITPNKLPYDSIGDCLFVSLSMKKIKQDLEMFIRYNTTDPILIFGEKGTGKESIASSIEFLSKKNIQAYNCSNISKELFESIMFGYKKGAFTGANEDRAGLFENTGDGILFLDEIGDLPYECQAKFLRVIQKREFARVGEETKRRKFNGRIVAATNRDLKQMVADGQFRGDLLDRLSVFTINLPPLNQRRDDIVPLAELFLRLHGQGEDFILSRSAKNYLIKKDHVANIRGLETTIKRAIVHALSKSVRVITEELVKDQSSTTTSSISTSSSDKPISPQQIEPFDISMNEYEKKIILNALNICGGNRKQTASSLKLLERRFYHLLKKHNINH